MMENKPEIRFQYNDEWNEKYISQCANVKQGFPFDSKTYVKNGRYNIITIGNVGGDRYVRGIEETNKVLGLPEGIQNYQILKENDILISMTGNVGRVSLNKGNNNLLNQRVDVLQKKENIDGEFLFQRLCIPDFERQMNLNGQGAAQLNISNSDIENYKILVPLFDEQMDISKCLSQFDEIIVNKNNKLKKTKLYKSSMLSKMFPKEGSLVPEIRFKEFVDEWNAALFGENFEKLSNNSFSRDLLNYKNGDFKNIHYGDILIKYGFSISVNDNVVPFINNEVEINQKQNDYLKTGDVVFADTAEDTTAGKMVEIFNDNNIKVISGLHTYPCRPLIKFYKGFLGIMLNTPYFHNQLVPYMQGTKVTGFNYNYLCKINIVYPTIDEQEKIVSFFTNLDEMISNQEKEIETLEHLKKTLLNKMFA